MKISYEDGVDKKGLKKVQAESIKSEIYSAIACALSEVEVNRSIVLDINIAVENIINTIKRYNLIMIKQPISAELDCLRSAGIYHSLFISYDQCELHLWDSDKLSDTLSWLTAFEIKPDSIVSMNDATPGELFYIIKF